uniref:Uncharacterized protein n=1 Tax=Oryza brachyantha TaxID=4533 RepID=J3MT80_ORYBR
MHALWSIITMMNWHMHINTTVNMNMTLYFTTVLKIIHMCFEFLVFCDLILQIGQEILNHGYMILYINLLLMQFGILTLVNPL